MKLLKIIFSLLLGCSAYVGDYVVFKSELSNSFVLRAIFDNIIHGTIGFFSALAFYSHESNLNMKTCIMNVLICTSVSCLIDIDHFLVAKSFHLKDLSNLKQRGIFHNTTCWTLLSVLLLLYSYHFRNINVLILNCMVILAFSSHHIRDANRRGLWIYPLGHSPAIDKHLYVLLLMVLPHCIAWFCSISKEHLRVNIEYTHINTV